MFNRWFGQCKIKRFYTLALLVDIKYFTFSFMHQEKEIELTFLVYTTIIT